MILHKYGNSADCSLFLVYYNLNRNKIQYMYKIGNHTKNNIGAKKGVLR